MATLLEMYTQQAEEQKSANVKRKKAIEAIFDEVISRYGPGGSFGKGYESLLEGRKVQDVGATAQRDISRGMYGIRPYEAEWEATTGATERLRLEDIKMERLSSAQLGKASFLEGIQEPYPDYSALMQAYAAQGAAPSGGYGGGSTSSGSLTSLPGRTGQAATPAEGDYSPGWKGGGTPSEGGTATYDPTVAVQMGKEIKAGEAAGAAPAGAEAPSAGGYPTMAQALKQGVGAVGTDSKGTPYRLTEKGWVRL